MPAPPPGLRLAEPLAALSLATDLARGHPQDEALRATVVATRIAADLGAADADLETVYYATLLRFVGCTATSQLYIETYGISDIAVRDRGDYIDPTSAKEAIGFLASLSGGQPLPRRLGHLFGTLHRARSAVPEAARADCEVGAALVRQFGLSRDVQEAVLRSFERWDGKGAPDGLRGEALPLATRIAQVAYTAVMFAEIDPEIARETLRRRAGTALDPDVAEAALRTFGVVEASLSNDAWHAVLDTEPAPHRHLHDDQLSAITRGYAHVADLKADCLHGHSDGVAQLAATAGAIAGLDEAAARVLVHAAHLHDIGRVAIDSRIWAKPGALTVAEWEKVRLHPYHTERILKRAPCLEPLRLIAASHHERGDGSGYHRGVRSADLPISAEILIAADCFHALRETRPHREALPAREAAAIVRELRVDPAATGAVLEAGGEKRPRDQPRPAGLSEREIAVLRLLARGQTKVEAAAALHVSPATVHTHTMHIYDKIGARSRAALALFAMENGLLDR